MNYHAHIYWSDKTQRELALSLRQKLAELGCRIGTVWDMPIGPHPLPMYQVNYNDDIKNNVETLLSTLGLVVLLHEDTGNDILDHTVGARWLGEALGLDLEWLKAHSELA